MPDVLIHNMELPKKDGLLSINIWPNGSVTIAMDLECKPVARAVELPEHGDLISKQTALAALYSDYAYAAMDLIENEVPVIIPATEEAK